MKQILGTLIVLAGLAAAGLGGFIWSGFYDISATDQHLPPTYWLIEQTMKRSVSRRGERIEVPPLGAPEQVARVKDRMYAIAAKNLPGTRAELTFEEGYPPMAPTPGNKRLLALLNEANREGGLPEVGELDPMLVHTPGVFVQRVVHTPDVEKRIERRTVRAV